MEIYLVSVIYKSPYLFKKLNELSFLQMKVIMQKIAWHELQWTTNYNFVLNVHRRSVYP
jgi:hypothetical protein